MSKYEWERGSIVIPAASWVAFRKSMISAWNTEQERLFALAVTMRERVEAAAKGKRGFDRRDWLRTEMRARCWGSNGESERGEDFDAVCGLLGLTERYVNATVVDGKVVVAAHVVPAKSKAAAPKRKDLRILPISRGARLDIGEASIDLNDETRTVRWSVSENNHACDTARSLPLARTFFSLLGRIEWTRGSGGKIVGNDEYHRDSDGEGDGGNYVTAEYGPGIAKAAKSSFGGRW